MPTSTLVRGMGRLTLIAFTVNLTIGAGILGLQGRIQALVGNYSIFVIAATGLLLALIAGCFAELGSRFDRTGGPQLYTATAFGPLAGFAVGWLLLLSRVGSCAAVANLLVDYGTVLWPPLHTPVARVGVIALLAIAYLLVNIRGIRETAVVSTALAVTKLLPLAIFVVIGAAFVDLHDLQLGSTPSLPDLSSAVLLSAYAFFGFDATTILAGEVRDPARTVPISILASIAIVLVLYVAIQIVCVGTLPELATSTLPLTDAATKFVGNWGAIALAITAVISCAGVYGASFTPGTRLVLALAEHGQLPKFLGGVHARHRTPVAAIIVTTAVVLALAWSGSFIYLAKFTLAARIAVYAVTCLALPALRHRTDVPAALFALPAGTLIAYSAVAICAFLVAGSSMREVIDAAIALLVGFGILGVTRFFANRS